VLVAGLALTGSLRGFAQAVLLTPGDGDPDWHIPFDADAAAAPELRPEVLRLDAAIDRYRNLVGAGGWPEVAAGAPLAPGQRDARVVTLRDRLRQDGDYAAEMGADPWFFDRALRDGVQSFQQRHGLPATGSVDERTRDELNLPAATRLQQLEATRQRWRWLPRELGRRHAIANIPAATLELVADNATERTLRTVVGHPDRPTPSLLSNVAAVVFRPDWSVPRRIAVEDLLPQQQADPGFLDRLGFRVLDDRGRRIRPRTIDWTQLSPARFPYRLVQAPGPVNSLGAVKLVLDNPYDIYLHDSPSRPLFDLTYRTLGSGCIRLEDAGAVVSWMLAGQPGWSDAVTAARLASARPTTVRPDPAAPPVWIVYLTSRVDADGRVHFRRDVYGRDARLFARLTAAGH
jgi:L,D-transpeptidase YcbB